MKRSARMSQSRSSGSTQLSSPSSPATLALMLRRRAMGAASGGGLDGTCHTPNGALIKPKHTPCTRGTNRSLLRRALVKNAI